MIIPGQSAAQTDPPANGIRALRRIAYLSLGGISVLLALLGAFLPVLPTTPFLLLASYFFVRSSPALNAWLLRSPLFGPFLRDWYRHRGVRLRVKITAVIAIVIAIGASAVFGNLAPWMIALLIVLGVVGLVVVLRLPLVREDLASGAQSSGSSLRSDAGV